MTTECRPRSRWAFLASLTVLPALPLILVGIAYPTRSGAAAVGTPSVAWPIALVAPLAPPADDSMTAKLAPEPTTQSVMLYNQHTRETATFELPFDGVIQDPIAAKAFGHFFRDPRTGRNGPMAVGEVAMLADLARQFPGHTIEVVSGWRAPPQGAPKSKHFKGHAIDLRIPGVKTAEVRDYLWLKHHHVGVGYYPGQNFIHCDSRPTEMDMAWTSRREGAPNHYHPYWAERLLATNAK